MDRIMKKIILWLLYEDGHMERKQFSSTAKAVSWLEKHPEIKKAGRVLT